MSNLSFYKCQHPIRIVNQYTGKTMYVDCRTCPSCLNKKALVLKNRLVEQFKETPIASLLTLHYDNEHLPMVRPYFQRIIHRSLFNGKTINKVSYERCDDYIFNDIDFFDTSSSVIWIHDDYFVSKRKIVDDDYFFLDNTAVKQYYRPVGVSPLDDGFGALSKDDIIKFLKRIRINIQRFCKLNGLDYEQFKFKYFVAGEYGPTTMRPHYHAIFFFSSRRARDVFSSFVHKSWKNGSYDLRSAGVGTSDYLASYVTSLAHLPEALRGRCTRPFTLSTKAPLLGFREDVLEKVREQLVNGYSLFREFSTDKNGFPMEHGFCLPKQIISSWLPRCVGYSQISFDEKLKIYEFIYELVQRGKSYEYALDTMKAARFCVNSTLNLYLPTFSYLDILSARRCFFWCNRLRILPCDFLRMLDHYYLSRDCFLLRKQFEYFNFCCDYSFFSFDLDFVRSLPRSVDNIVNYDHFCDVFFSYGLNFDDYFSSVDGSSCFPETFDQSKSFFKVEYDKLSLKIFNDHVKKRKHNDYLQNSFYLRNRKNICFNKYSKFSNNVLNF